MPQMRDGKGNGIFLTIPEFDSCCVAHITNIDGSSAESVGKNREEFTTEARKHGGEVD